MSEPMSEPMQDLQPYQEDERADEAPTRRYARLRPRLTRPSWEGARQRVRNARSRLQGARLAIRRATLEARATLRSSAALAGLSRDARQVKDSVREDVHRVSEKVRDHLPKDSATAAGMRKDLWLLRGTLAWHLRAAGRRAGKGGRSAKARLMRSAFLSGLAIDSHRVAKRLRASRHPHGTRISH
jgi:hypothetical protein